MNGGNDGGKGLIDDWDDGGKDEEEENLDINEEGLKGKDEEKEK